MHIHAYVADLSSAYVMECSKLSCSSIQRYVNVTNIHELTANYTRHRLNMVERIKLLPLMFTIFA